MALTAAQLATIYTISGLYGAEQGWVGGDTVNQLAVYIGAVDGDVYDTAYNNRLAVECIKVALARGITSERAESLRRRIAELLSRPSALIVSPTTSAALNAEIAARRHGDETEAIDRAAADVALGVRIDNIPVGTDDQVARQAAADALAAAAAADAKAVINTGAITDITTGIGDVSDDEPTIAAWVTNFRQGVSGNAQAIAALQNGPVQQNTNNLVDEIAARELADTTEANVRLAADNALGVRIDNIPVGTDDQVARQAAADALAAAAAADALAEANKVEIGDIPAPIATVGGWITNLGQAVQLDADEEGTLNNKINGVNNRLVDEVTARENQGTTFTEASGQNAIHIADEVTARTQADDALGVRIDNIEVPAWTPGIIPNRWPGSDRATAIAGEEEYFLGEVSLSQAYVNIFASGMASHIRVTLDPSVPTQVGAAGNDWNLVLGTDHANASVTIVPDTPAKTFTLRLPAAGITLDVLAADLNHNSRLNTEVVGNGLSLVNYAATWGPNPVVGSMSPFGNGGDQSTTERTAYRASYIANPNHVIVLDYDDTEEYRHWSTTLADWETVLTLIDPQLPIWSPAPTQNFFEGATRTEANAARDLYSLRNAGVVQASRFLPLGTSPTVGVRVTLTSDVAIGGVGNTWVTVANGSAFEGSNSATAYDIVGQELGINYNDATLTAAELAHILNVTPGFSAELEGGISPSAVGFIAAQLAGMFSGGVNAGLNPRTAWVAILDADGDLYITIRYGQIIERQVRRHSMWVTVDTIQLPLVTPAGVHLLTHPNASPGENFSWWQNVTNSAVGQSFIERTGGTIPVPEVGSEYLTIPATNSIIYFRLSDGNNTVITTLAHLVLPDGTRVASAVTVMLGAQPILITILASGRVVGTRPTSGTTNVGLDAWVQ